MKRLLTISMAIILTSVVAGAACGWLSPPMHDTPADPLGFAHQLRADGWASNGRLNYVEYVLRNNFIALLILYGSSVASGGLGAIFFFFAQGMSVGRLAQSMANRPHGLFTTLLLTGPHGIFELAGFTVAGSSLLAFAMHWARRLLGLRSRETPGEIARSMVRLNLIGAGLLVIAAFIEAFVTPDLSVWLLQK